MVKCRFFVSALAATGLLLALISTASAGGGLLNGVSASASDDFGGAYPATYAIDPTDLIPNNQHDPAFGTSPTTTNWLTTSVVVDEQWIFVDLGAAYDLGKINIWNYYEDASWAGGFWTESRGVADHTLWVGGAGATLPVNGTPSLDPFTAANGWSQVSFGTLVTAPPGSYEDPPGSGTYVKSPAISATDVLWAAGYNAQYVGINVDTNIAGNATDYLGISQIQVFEIPEPATMALLGLGGLAALRRRRR